MRLVGRFKQFSTISRSPQPIWRKAAIGVAGLSTAYWIDSEFNACTFQRNIRTLWNGLCITLDYKLFFHPGADVSSIHQRVAERILYTCQKNAGLYVKFGQSVASMNHILPPQYNETLKSLFADAPIMEFDQVLRIFKEEFDCHPDDLFDEFERAPVASASIAQVHRARLKTDGTVVAVKVQKHYIRRQLFWDMLAFRFIIRAFEYFFELPLSWSADYTERHLREEIDFCKEADNADRARADFSKCSQLAETVYIPQVYREFSTERIMTSEWIEGISLTDKDRLRLEGYPITRIMHDIISAFSYQIFHSGFVHGTFIIIYAYLISALAS
jgi:aarF domain-containing kinase